MRTFWQSASASGFSLMCWASVMTTLDVVVAASSVEVCVEHEALKVVISGVESAGGAGAPRNVELVRVKERKQRVILAITYRDGSRGLVRALHAVQKDSSGRWTPDGSFSSRRPMPGRGDIWLCAGGWSSGEGGGWLAESGVARIRATDPSGAVTQDAPEGRVALFMPDDAFDLFGSMLDLAAVDGRVLKTGPFLERHGKPALLERLLAPSRR